MAIFHLALKTISRGKGQSAVASSAYRSGSRLEDRETGETKDFSKKHGVAYSEIQLPEQAPVGFNDREKLWNAVQSKESRRNSQLAREVEVALPAELDRDTQVKLVHDYVQQNFVDKGMCADWSIHDKEDGNPHAHIMLTTRAIKKNGDWAPKKKSGYLLDENGAKVPQIDPKTGQQKIGARNQKIWKRTTESYTDWDNQDNAEKWRSNWSESCNQYLAPENKIDHRSYERQGVEQIPTIHEGHVAREMGDRSERVQTNNDIKAGNHDLSSLSAKIVKIQEEARTLFRRIAELTELIRKRLQKKAEADCQAEQPTQSGPAPRSVETTPNVADNFLKKLNADKAKQAKPAPPEESVAGDFLKKLNSDRSKRQAHKYRERTHDQGGPEL